VQYALDHRDVAERTDVDLVEAHAPHATRVLHQPQILVLVDAPAVAERADEVVAQVLVKPGRVRFR
jgi:hypothetical protein